MPRLMLSAEHPRRRPAAPCPSGGRSPSPSAQHPGGGHTPLPPVPSSRQRQGLGRRDDAGSAAAVGVRRMLTASAGLRASPPLPSPPRREGGRAPSAGRRGDWSGAGSGGGRRPPARGCARGKLSAGPRGAERGGRRVINPSPLNPFPREADPELHP